MTARTRLERERREIGDFGRALLEHDLTSGTGGNISARDDDGYVAISPSGVPYPKVSPESVPIVGPDGELTDAPNEPSSELPMHALVYEAREDARAIVHTHSPYATTFAALGRPIEAVHYLVGFGGVRIPVADYATYGTVKLGENAAAILDDDLDACLLQNHGVIAVGTDVESAFETALNVEYAARIQYQAEAIGDPIVLDDEEMGTIREKFRDYGQSGQG